MTSIMYYEHHLLTLHGLIKHPHIESCDTRSEHRYLNETDLFVSWYHVTKVVSLVIRYWCHYKSRFFSIAVSICVSAILYFYVSYPHNKWMQVHCGHIIFSIEVFNTFDWQPQHILCTWINSAAEIITHFCEQEKKCCSCMNTTFP